MKYILAATATAILCIFTATAPPTIYLGDSGEIAAAACTLGIGHPPGYPLYTMAAKISTLLPLGDQAYRINLLAALFGALSFMMFYLCMSLLIEKAAGDNSLAGNRLPSFAMALVFIFSGLFWFETTHVKGGIYSMECFTALALLWGTLKYAYEKQGKFMVFTAFMAGLLPVVHPTGWLASLFAVAAAVMAGGRPKKNILIAAAAAFIAALALPNLYILIRAGAAEIRWSDTGTFPEIIRHITRSVYAGGDSPPFGVYPFFFKLKEYAAALAANYNAAVIFAAAGLCLLYRSNRKLLYALAGFFMLNLGGIIFFTHNSPSGLYVYTNSGFYLLNDLVIILLAVFGARAVPAALRNRAAAAGATAALLLWACAMPALNFGKNDRSAVFLAYDLAENVFKTAGAGGAVFARSDFSVFNMHYLKYIKKQFRDIRAYDEMGNVLDLSYIKPAREDGGRISKAIRDEIITGMEKASPGSLYFYEITDFPEKGLFSRPYGLLYKFTGNARYFRNAGGLMQVYSYRDCFRNKYPDYINRNILARYYVKSAEFAAIEGNPEKFNFYRLAAETVAFDIPNVLRGIAYVFFTWVNDMNSTLLYLEKSMENDPYDFPTINLLIDMYKHLQMWDKAAAWYRVYYHKEWDPENRARLLRELQYLENKYKLKS